MEEILFNIIVELKQTYGKNIDVVFLLWDLISIGG